MTFIFKDHQYSLPSLLTDITLQTYIGWSQTYGKDLDEEYRALSTITDEDELTLRKSLLYFDRITKAFSYYSLIPLDQVTSEIDIRQVMSYVGATQLSLAYEEQELSRQDSYTFQGQQYAIYPPDQLVKQDTYAQFMATKDLAGYMLSLSAGDWSVMPSICAAYLRTPGQEFDPNNFRPGSALAEKMKGLTMDIALAVASFLGDTLTLFVRSLELYVPAEAVVPDTPPGGNTPPVSTTPK